MIEYRLRAKAESVRDFERFMDRLERFPDTLIPQAAVEATEIWIRTVDRKFAMEGPDWPELAESTVRERTHLLGPGLGAHPILERFGYLRRSLTDTTYGGPHTVSYPRWTQSGGFGTEPIETGNEIQQIDVEPGHRLYRWVLYDERFEFLVDERPMVPVDEEAEVMCEEIEDALIQLVAKMGGPNA